MRQAAPWPLLAAAWPHAPVAPSRVPKPRAPHSSRRIGDRGGEAPPPTLLFFSILFLRYTAPVDAGFEANLGLAMDEVKPEPFVCPVNIDRTDLRRHSGEFPSSGGTQK